MKSGLLELGVRRFPLTKITQLIGVPDATSYVHYGMATTTCRCSRRRGQFITGSIAKPLILVHIDLGSMQGTGYWNGLGNHRTRGGSPYEAASFSRVTKTTLRYFYLLLSILFIVCRKEISNSPILASCPPRISSPNQTSPIHVERMEDRCWQTYGNGVSTLLYRCPALY